MPRAEQIRRVLAGDVLVPFRITVAGKNGGVHFVRSEGYASQESTGLVFHDPIVFENLPDGYVHKLECIIPGLAALAGDWIEVTTDAMPLAVHDNSTLTLEFINKLLEIHVSLL